MVAAAATRGIRIVPAVRLRRSAHDSGCPSNPLPALDHRLPDAVASLVFAPVRRRRLRLEHGPGRGPAAGGAASRPTGAALLQLDRAGSVVWLLPEACRGGANDLAAPAGAAAHGRRPCAPRCGLDLQPGVPAGRRVVFTQRD